MLISQIASITKYKYNKNTKKQIEQLNKAIKYTHNYLVHLLYRKFSVAAPRIFEYSDAAFGNNDDLSLQLVQVIFRVNTDENAALIAFNCYV